MRRSLFDQIERFASVILTGPPYMGSCSRHQRASQFSSKISVFRPNRSHGIPFALLRDGTKTDPIF